jgi:hypothetical protein
MKLNLILFISLITFVYSSVFGNFKVHDSSTNQEIVLPLLCQVCAEWLKNQNINCNVLSTSHIRCDHGNPDQLCTSECFNALRNWGYNCSINSENNYFECSK